MRIRLTKPAERDLESVEEYIRQDNPAAAIKTVLRVLEAVECLEQFPNIGRPGRVTGTRELVVGGTLFLAIYKVKENVIWVLRVLHAARKWPPR